MKPRTLAIVLAAGAILLAATQTASAQRYQGRDDNPVGPTVSPYLNLLGTNQFGVTNYQSLVRPLINQGNAIQRQQGSLNSLQQQFNAQGAGVGRGTGHATFFMNYSHFYYNARGAR